MTLRDPELVAAVAPVREALLEMGRRDAERTAAAARAATDELIGVALDQAARITAEAEEQGAADANAAVAVARSAARRTAHGIVLAARREAYDTLRARARVAMELVRADPSYGLTRRRLVNQVYRVLGPDAVVREGADGGVVGEAGARRVDLSLARFADLAVDAVAAQEEGT
jgi:vacuolar-type H+-ATPase subunit E/Vma4